MFLKSIQSQFKTIQPQVKKGRKEKNTGEPERLPLVANANSNLYLQMQGPARGYPLRTCFLHFFKDFEKEKSCFGEAKIFEFLVLLMVGHY